jgi:hypothetical protein
MRRIRDYHGVEIIGDASIIAGLLSRTSFPVVFGILTPAPLMLLASRAKLGGRAAAITSLATLGGLPVTLMFLAAGQRRSSSTIGGRPCFGSTFSMGT